MRAVIESAAIYLVSSLLIIFVFLYFMVTKRQKKLNALTDLTIKNNADNTGVISEWAEQLQIMQTQIDLMCELSPAFIVCCDYGRDCFSISENGQIQLGIKNIEQIDEQKFEELIHPDDMLIYEEVTEVENIRKAELAESPYVIRLRQANSQNSQDYNSYLMRIKPVYSETGLSAALVLAFINTEYLEDK